MTYPEMFAALQPGFFDKPYIAALPEEEIYEEQVIDLHAWQAGAPLPCPAHITFGFYRGDADMLRAAVREVDEDWPQWFGRTDRVFCAFDGPRVVSFCILDAFGEADGKKVGAPGCVGTIPAYRRQGIGLRMIQLATEILRQEGYDLSWIHYTAVGHWYARLGYETVIRWNCKGIIT